MRLINRCPHVWKSGIYGDEINHSAGYRLRCDNCGRLLDGPVSLAQDLPQIIRTVQELKTLDPDTWLMQADEEAIPMVVDDWVHDYNFDSDGIFPLVVMMDGAQVRAARKALEQEHG